MEKQSNPLVRIVSNAFQPKAENEASLDPMHVLPAALVKELIALKRSAPNSEIKLTVYCDHCEMKFYL